MTAREPLDKVEQRAAALHHEREHPRNQPRRGDKLRAERLMGHRRELALPHELGDGGALVHAAVARDGGVGDELQRDGAAQLGRLDQQLVEHPLTIVAQHAPRHVPPLLRLVSTRLEMKQGV